MVQGNLLHHIIFDGNVRCAFPVQDAGNHRSSVKSCSVPTDTNCRKSPFLHDVHIIYKQRDSSFPAYFHNPVKSLCCRVVAGDPDCVNVFQSRYKTTFVFGETVKDSFGIRLPGHDSRDWFLTENNPDFDSLTVWITDTLIAARDTLPLEISYFQTDSLNRRFVARDTVRLVYTEKEKTEVRRKKKESEIPETVQFLFSDNILSDKFDLNNSILITSPEPVKRFDLSKIKLFLADDSPA